ncbi:MAG: methyltransferase domain-containing protein [Thermodesulfobacteriota bacterium]
MKERERQTRSAKVKQAFSQAAQEYDGGAGLQRVVAEELLEGITSLGNDPSTFDTILDIGCGTGFLTIGLKKRFPGAAVAGCDIAHPMVIVTSSRVEGDTSMLVTSDGAALPFKASRFNLVASNLTYQWFPELSDAFSEAYRVLTPGGVFAFTLLGEGTFKELKSSYMDASRAAKRNGLPPLMDFPSSLQVNNALESAGFHHTAITFPPKRRFYEDLFSLLKCVRRIGAANPSPEGDRSLGRGSLLREMARLYRERFSAVIHTRQEESHTTTKVEVGATAEEHIYATYNVLFCTARKK